MKKVVFLLKRSSIFSVVIPKFSILLKFSIGFFSVFNIFGIQLKISGFKISVFRDPDPRPSSDLSLFQ